MNLFVGSVGSLRGTYFEWFPEVSLDIIMKVQLFRILKPRLTKVDKSLIYIKFRHNYFLNLIC